METNLELSKFWTRVGAFLVDVLILGLLGFLLGLIFDDYFVRIGEYGRLYGLVIAVAYQTIGNSKVANGQTLGKRLFNIQVVDIHGSTLGIGKSLLRSLIYSFPYFVATVPVPGMPVFNTIYAVKASVLDFVFICDAVIFIFNKGTRQSLHDLLLGTYVVQIERSEQPFVMPAVTKASFYAVGVITVLFVAALIGSLFWSNATSDKFLQLDEKLLQIDGVLNASVVESTTYGRLPFEKSSETHSYQINLYVMKLPPKDMTKEKVVRDAAAVLLSSVEGIDSVDYISISLTRQFDIGIATGKRGIGIKQSPQKWREDL